MVVRPFCMARTASRSFLKQNSLSVEMRCSIGQRWKINCDLRAFELCEWETSSIHYFLSSADWDVGDVKLKKKKKKKTRQEDKLNTSIESEYIRSILDFGLHLAMLLEKSLSMEREWGECCGVHNSNAIKWSPEGLTWTENHPVIQETLVVCIIEDPDSTGLTRNKWIKKGDLEFPQRFGGIFPIKFYVGS